MNLVFKNQHLCKNVCVSMSVCTGRCVWLCVMLCTVTISGRKDKGTGTGKEFCSLNNVLSRFSGVCTTLWGTQHKK